MLGQQRETPLMSDECWNWSCDESIPSQRGAGQEIVSTILEQLQTQQWNERDVFGVHLALEEALVNAIIHGNGLDAEKLVQVKCQIGPQRFAIEIRDQGAGFKAADVPDPTDCENIERPCGRGLMLMRSFMTSVEFNEQGNCVSMEKLAACEKDSLDGEPASGNSDDGESSNSDD